MSERPLKVLSVCASDSSGGAARAAYRIHLAVRDLGVDSHMFVKEKRTEDDKVIALQEFIPSNSFYRVFDWIRNKIKNKWQHLVWSRYPNRSDYYMSDLRSTDIHGALKKIDYEVLHLHWINQRFLPLDRLPEDTPIIWTLHDCWPFCGVCHYFNDCNRYQFQCGQCPMLGSTRENDMSRLIWRRKSKWYSRRRFHIVTPSQWLAECARSSSLLGAFPVSVIPNCIDTHSFRPLEESEVSSQWLSFQKLKKHTNILLYGAMNALVDKRKGYSYLLSALTILKEHDSDLSYELVVFGGDKSMDDLSGLIQIHHIGYVNNSKDLVSLYNCASLMLVPSLSENLSCTIMESLSCGTPVIAFNIGGNGDMIDHQENGYLAKEYDSEDFANGIRWCLENNKDGHLSRNARKKVLENYTPEIVGKQYADLYSSLRKP